MFTIRQKSFYDGTESLYEAKAVRIAPPIDRLPADHDNRTLWFDTPDGICASIDSGDIYVMNQNGRTVASYALGLMPAPRGVPAPHNTAN